MQRIPLGRLLFSFGAVVLYGAWRAGKAGLEHVRAPQPLSKSILINKPLAEVRERLNEAKSVIAAFDPETLHLSAASATLTKVTAATDDDARHLRRFKALMETGEIATIEGQSHGQRSPLGKAFGSLIQSPRLPTASPREVTV